MCSPFRPGRGFKTRSRVLRAGCGLPAELISFQAGGKSVGFRQAAEAGGVQTFLILRTPFCALLWRWALKNVGTCFLQAPRSKKLSIRYVFHGAGAPHRNSDAQKAHCFQQGLNCKVFWSALQLCRGFDLPYIIKAFIINPLLSPNQKPLNHPRQKEPHPVLRMDIILTPKSAHETQSE